ncbi:MAG: hypothetical protein DRQ55_00845 [Planctomycetota bacterium]|nr:MAG: hypothetical protein DRQ55_00845 [Planctomycetota bacterium]
MTPAVPVGAAHELVEGAMLRLELDGRLYGVCRLEGRLVGFDARCPHVHADLTEGVLADGGVDCPQHLWHFDLRNGACTMVPDYAIELFEVRERDGQLELMLP